jgi:ligand-binding SRPBCC domain-containing protein
MRPRAELRFRITTPQPVVIGPGARIDYSLRLFNVPFSWSTLISKWDPPNEFVDEQLRGPYRQWIHTHRFTESGGETVISDEVRYVLPLGVLGVIAAPVIGLQVKRIFQFREFAIRQLL